MPSFPGGGRGRHSPLGRKLQQRGGRPPSRQGRSGPFPTPPPTPRRRGRQHFSCGSAGSVQSCASATGPFLFFSPVSPPLAAPGQPGKEGSWCARFWVPMLGISGTTWSKWLSKNRYGTTVNWISNPKPSRLKSKALRLYLMS